MLQFSPQIYPFFPVEDSSWLMQLVSCLGHHNCVIWYFLYGVPKNVSALTEKGEKSGFHSQVSLGSSAHSPLAWSLKIHQSTSKDLRNPTKKPS